MPRRPVQRETQHEIGIRDLKAKLSEVVDEVREHEATYVITHRGKAVGRLVPMEGWTEEPSSTGGRPGERSGEKRAAWDELFHLAEEIGQGWEPGEDAVETLSRMRR